MSLQSTIFQRMLDRQKLYIDRYNGHEPYKHVSRVAVTAGTEKIQDILEWCNFNLDDDFVWRREVEHGVRFITSSDEQTVAFYFLDAKNATLFSLTWAS